MEQPEKVDFEVTVMGGSTLSGLIPSLKAWLVGFARDSLISMYVMPEHWTYRIDPVSPAVHTALLISAHKCICILVHVCPCTATHGVSCCVWYDVWWTRHTRVCGMGIACSQCISVQNSVDVLGLQSLQVYVCIVCNGTLIMHICVHGLRIFIVCKYTYMWAACVHSLQVDMYVSCQYACLFVAIMHLHQLEQVANLLLQSIKDVSVPAGMLEIDIIEAKNIPKGDYLSDSSPYVQ